MSKEDVIFESCMQMPQIGLATVFPLTPARDRHWMSPSTGCRWGFVCSLVAYS